MIVHAQPEYLDEVAVLEAGKRIILMTVWETDWLPQHWVPRLQSVERVLVPCRWNKDVFERSGVEVQVDVVPHVCEDETVLEASRGEARDRAVPYVFYTVGVWCGRKAIGTTVVAYLQAFRFNRNVVLRVKTTSENLSLHHFWARRISTGMTVLWLRLRTLSFARVELIMRDLNLVEMAEFYEQADCFISLTHSEGWGAGRV
ncbi:MAG: hypothetical protein J6386_13150 [Candidatus Synoicihabitans palmerolidicus]|nr:hypothetical protein [Candidatus Synoicihabitans palmerolidicus]